MEKNKSSYDVTTSPSDLFLVELRTTGWSVGVSHTPEERVLTTFFRLSRDQKSKLQYLKVKFYRVLDRVKVFMLGGKYVVPIRRLLEVDKAFKEIYREFLDLRKEFYRDLNDKWNDILPKMAEVAKRLGISESKLKRLKPSDESFIDMYYTITPLPSVLSEIYVTYEQFMEMANEREEYRHIAENIKREYERIIRNIREEYENKMNELNELVKKLREAIKERDKQIYKARIKGLLDDASDIAPILGEETVEDLKAKAEGLKEILSS